VLTEALTALAAAGGTAVVQAAGEDAWTGLRDRVAQWFARGSAEQEQAVLERLDRTAAALEAARPEDLERVRVGQEASWRTRFEMLLEGLNCEEQQRAADELRHLLTHLAGSRATAVGQHSMAITGDVNVHAETGSAAAVEMGNVRIRYSHGGSGESAAAPADPHLPDRSRG
jgi:hypothetical protein